MHLKIPHRLAEAVTQDSEHHPERRRWLEALPEKVDHLADTCELQLDDPYELGGTAAWIAPAWRRGFALEGDAAHPILRALPAALVIRRSDGRPVSWLSATLELLSARRGCARLAAHSADKRADPQPAHGGARV